jgi:hypothetical protein
MRVVEANLLCVCHFLFPIFLFSLGKRNRELDDPVAFIGGNQSTFIHWKAMVRARAQVFRADEWMNG